MVADALNHRIGINVTAKSAREFSMSLALVVKIPSGQKSRGVSHGFAIHEARQCNAAHGQHTVQSRRQVLEQNQLWLKITGREKLLSEVITNVCD